MTLRFEKLRRFAKRFRDDTSGLSLIELAITMPILVATGGWGAELSYVSLTNMRISQYALNLADTVSRLGTSADGGVTQLREADIDDAFQGIRLSGSSMKLGTYGRVTISSLENTKQSYDSDYVQRIHWQRCFGAMSGADYESRYPVPISAGSTNKASDAGTPMPNGIGAKGQEIKAPPDNGVMYVEIAYRYQPLFGTMFVGPRVVRFSASLLVRDNRDFQQIYNFAPQAPVMDCSKHSA